MTNSDAYRRLKQLFHEKRLPIESIEIELSNVDDPEYWGEVVFKDGEERIKITDTSEDFVISLFSIKGTVREGEDEFVDVSAKPVGGTDGYYENLSHFITKNEDPIEKGIENLQEGKSGLPDEVPLLEALDASVESEMDNEALLTVARNYPDTLALKWIELNELQDAYEDFVESTPHDPDRFEAFLNSTGDILQNTYLNTSPIQGYRDYRETTISDTRFLLNRMSDIRNKTHKEWTALSQNSGGKIEGDIGITRVLEDYAQHFELVRDPLRDLAATLDSQNNVNLDDTSDVIRFLKQKGHQNLVGTIIPEFRHGPSHMSIEVDGDEGLVNIYDRRGRGRSVEAQVGFQEVVHKHKKFRDLVDAIIFSFVLNEEVIVYRYLTSRDFVFRIVEHTEPGILNSSTGK